METNSWENTELQFGKGCLIMEILKVNIFFKILNGFRYWTCSTSLEPDFQYLVALCFEKTKFFKLYKTECLKHFVRDFKWFRISGL